ncbi:hypothetical protein H6F77_17735 [Microcoleus sp. FACHB-831]|uniref:DUF6658 family protein n=1 Tax=Microcoleus sp. FACHB-831 TaxID=2692827 RepID=UPI001687DC18|nr:DUF6658 family protein [Microcoleus sp. FACHB-831]MBD1922897.1 hypothetical protein [Microcoleus sp. FACHB-831]
MKKLTDLFKKVRLGQILTVFLAGVLLFTSTACNSGDSLGARPENPPVQMGGNNNPHKGGGDGYTNYKASTDPKAKNSAGSDRDRADLQLMYNQAIAANIESDAKDVLYPGSEGTQTDSPDIGPRGENYLEKEATQIPARRQPIPQGNVYEKVGEAFKDATSFIKDKSDEAGERPELQSNPALHK